MRNINKTHKFSILRYYDYGRGCLILKHSFARGINYENINGHSVKCRLAMTDASEKLHMMRLKSAWKEQDKYKEEIRSLRNELYSLRMCMKMRVAAKQRQTVMKENEIAENLAQYKSQIQLTRCGFKYYPTICNSRGLITLYL
jgi:hypothetical protein